MDAGTDIGFQKEIKALTEGTDLRVWSLIVTILGDLARDEGQRISGADLGEITGAIGIRAEAVRVALHRLRKDGWIESTRDGRTSLYGLTAPARAEARTAARRIYGPAPADPGLWHVLIAPDTPPGEGYVTLDGNACLGPGPAPDIPGAFTLEGTAPHIPEAIRTNWMPDALATEFAHLERLLAGLASALPDPLPADPWAELLALRILVIHHWRRLVLRLPPLPDSAMPTGWRGPACRALVADLTGRLGKPDRPITARA